ncbi:MAG TPA: glycosyltransferase [Candidatus Dormibacteraeota bacterium]|nr:glycosyltransferase [Candidatus Dormibacteraeota bacterium]
MTSNAAVNEEAVRPHPIQSAVVGVLVHNEQLNIERCLRAILTEGDGSARARSVVVVASGCTDETEAIVQGVAEEDPRVRLVVERERSGKAAAINLLLRESKAPIVVLVGGDVIFTPGSLLRLVEPFRDPSIGMTGARAVPTNPRVGIRGQAVNILWDLHHELSLTKPKLGEAVAFRRVFKTIDRNTLVDEAIMELLIRAQGLGLQYVPQAIVRNHGPETLGEFLVQRRRVYRGHLSLASATGYRVSSISARLVLPAAWRLWRKGSPAHFMLLTMALEAIARADERVARLLRRHQENGLWHPMHTSKLVVGSGQVLRSHHEIEQSIRFDLSDAAGDLRTQEVKAHFRRMLRADDRIKFDGSAITITFRGDDEAAAALRGRIGSQLSDSMNAPGDGAPSRENEP